MTREKGKESDTVYETRHQTDDSLYELPVYDELELGDGLVKNLGVEANDVLDAENITRQEEEDVVLEQTKKDYNFGEIKEPFDEGTIPESV